ncbi:MAG TPA: UDP-N-acetylmuramoyl-tripeptide--D-alanyl-D-alanine ligase [Novimethylophilus sp.]|jgi:UDP-N-acetylmuramoyl-tripeptide--D-alanyl-D-alanine ligase|uniref:UDP-N-acetylmuramoyl-tripeptide--D-alanyl-D- alanine ligase n=1 Tax=Novimethylophilus sp. TaxID=2137426 RepID=UPI002F429CA9
MMTLAEAALATKGLVVGANVAFNAVTTDSRKAAPGDLFVALQGEHFDGHDYVAQCFEQGAVAAMIGERSAVSGQLAAKPMLVVADTRLGLGDLAAHWRGKFALPLAAVTGSNGKTTVKEMLAAIVRVAAGNDAVLATEGNLNNDIGLPLTLFKLASRHRYAVIEMGMNHPGEIAYLTRIAKPTVALINNAQPAHLEGLGSMDAVARAKGEIFEGLAANGTAAINADDAFASLWKQLAAPHSIMTFGLEQAADVSADYRLSTDGSDLTLKTPQGPIRLHLAVPGLHNVRNALAAATAALAMGVALADIAAGLAGFGGVKGRLQRKAGCRGVSVIDDTYNANPASMRAAIQVLAQAAGKKLFVMGDMGELGAEAPKLHAEIGAAAKAAGIDRLYALGDLSRESVKAFGAGARHFEAVEFLWSGLQGELASGVTVLVKGSRFMRMERVVDLLAQQENASCC